MLEILPHRPQRCMARRGAAGSTHLRLLSQRSEVQHFELVEKVAAAGLRHGKSSEPVRHGFGRLRLAELSRRQEMVRLELTTRV